MPCYLFTYHAYGSWVPDRKQGYVIRKRGILPQNQELAVKYRQCMTEKEKKFGHEMQQSIIRVLLQSREKQEFDCHFIATDCSHTHVLLAWRDVRRSLRMRSTIKGSITRHLRNEFGAYQWLSEGGSRKQVKDLEHFDYLVNVYLPRHRGWKWELKRGLFL